MARGVLSPFKIENSAAEHDEFNKMNRGTPKKSNGRRYRKEGDRCFCIFPSVDRYPKTKRIRSIFVLNAALTYILETIDLNSVLSLSMLEIRFSQKDTPETAFTTSLAAEIKKVSSGIQSASLDISYFWDISRAGNSVEGSLFAMMMVIMMME